MKLSLHPGHVASLLLMIANCIVAADTARAEDSGKDPVADLARYDALVKAADRQHWAFQQVRIPGIPAVNHAPWLRNPIDNFVLAKLEAHGWHPAPAVEPRAWLRRLYLDLIGLPPTLAEQEVFVRDASPTAEERVIQDLLSRPAHGERWARHWLDLVRYAESNGYERDATKPNVWRFRDYVIRAFNDDKPFDRFLMEQLAGDELDDASAETLIASGYCRLGPWDDEPADPAEDRFDQLDDMVSTTAQVFMGLTLGCARCHNHKFERLSMHDYYRMVAIFDPLRRPQPGRPDVDLPAGSRAELDALARRDQEISALSRKANTHRQRLAGYPVMMVGSGFSPLTAMVSGRFLVENRRPIADSRKKITTLDQQILQLRKAKPDLPRAYFLREPASRPPETHLLLRGKAARPGPAVAPGVPAVLVSSQPAFPPPGQRTSLRRLTLARWLARADHPLTARVIVNRVWQFHFGEGIVRTPSDFGVMGDRPTHPELLDWLAGWFVQEGWSLKKLHRLILTSNSYRMSKRWHPDYGAKDPDNRLLWRVPYRRLEAEAIRDSMLAVGGQLQTRMYGPSMYPHVPQEALAGSSDPDKIWRPFDESDASRRTIYAFMKRSLVVPLLEVLDLCDSARNSARRGVTTVAPQALSLFNGDFVNRQARHLARRLLREAGTDPERQIELAYRLALCRPPKPAERTAMMGFLQRDAGAGHQALEQLGRVLLNLNEFVYTD